MGGLTATPALCALAGAWRTGIVHQGADRLTVSEGTRQLLEGGDEGSVEGVSGVGWVGCGWIWVGVGGCGWVWGGCGWVWRVQSRRRGVDRGRCAADGELTAQLAGSWARGLEESDTQGRELVPGLAAWGVAYVARGRALAP